MTRAERVRDYAMEEVTEEGEKGRQRRRPLSYRESKHYWEGAPPPRDHAPRVRQRAQDQAPGGGGGGANHWGRGRETKHGMRGRACGI